MEVSVIVTNYNYQKWLARCIRSLLNQSFSKEEFEIVVIDDCSTDRSVDLIKSFDDQIVPIFNDENMGLAASCNVAIRKAKGKFFIRVDADDFVHKDFLKVHHLFLTNNKDMDSTSCDYLELDERENILRRRCGSTFPIACATLFKTDDIIEIGLYDENLPREDFDLRKRLLQNKKFIYNIPVPLYRYTIHQNSMTENV